MSSPLLIQFLFRWSTQSTQKGCFKKQVHKDAARDLLTPFTKLLDLKNVAFDSIMSDTDNSPIWPRPPTNVKTASLTLVLKAGIIDVQLLIDAYKDKYKQWFHDDLAKYCTNVDERCDLRIFEAIPYMMTKDKYKSFYSQILYQYGAHLDRWFGRSVQSGECDSGYMRGAKWTQNADEVVGEDADMWLIVLKG